ncbi:MAG: DUF2703 domain-containing protein [Lutisporaceae bacterium]
MSNSSGCCSCGNGCCGSEQKKKQILIDFLYLDLSVCERCQGTENNLDEAIREVAGVLKAAGFEIVVNKVNITSKELAIKYQFLSSPTIRINGNDIELEVKESSCKECGDLCGDDVDCRVWVHEGIEYNEPPKSMIVNAILKEVYGDNRIDAVKMEEYVLPDNLKMFFDGLHNKKDI